MIRKGKDFKKLPLLPCEEESISFPLPLLFSVSMIGADVVDFMTGQGEPEEQDAWLSKAVFYAMNLGRVQLLLRGACAICRQFYYDDEMPELAAPVMAMADAFQAVFARCLS